MKKRNTLIVDKDELVEMNSFCNDYIHFLNECKTERESISFIENKLKESGFDRLEDKTSLKKGDKVYFVNHKKSIYAAIIGTAPLTDGVNIIGSHVDTPRLDLKPSPLYEEKNISLLKTHYYGGIKKYQWTAIPLSLHGIIYTKDGNKKTISIGDKEGDPVFTISDLLPHLSRKQYEKRIGDAIKGEELNVLVGNISSEENSSKSHILEILEKDYNIDEESFLSAELTFVPAFNAKSLGFDQSMIAGYGQDDRSCAYASLEAFLSTESPSISSICIFADKEEVGSMGNTGMESEIFDYFMSEVLDKRGYEGVNSLKKLYYNSKMLSADVTAAYDPNAKYAFDKLNCAYLGSGVALNKYTGSGGKKGASDASSEYVHFILNLFKEHNISYQVTELGKIDYGGGGTIAFILANKGINVIDCGVAVLSMHAPYEVINKFDLYSLYKAYKLFFQTDKKLS